jgi:hypothetical protein
LESLYGDAAASIPAARDDLDTLLITVRWFRRHPEELWRTIEPAKAMAACQDRLTAVERRAGL